ncbi:hypothetical protein HDU85_005160 [Gaertneriomyces sp. JEL0708]|nr:hypothetical protein HDU85_005160 [Gaertneriomyces sp. JEL0708]
MYELCSRLSSTCPGTVGLTVLVSSTKVKVLYFAGAKDAVGTAEEEVVTPEEVTSVPEFLDLLISQHPELEKAMQTSVLAVNMEYVEKDGTLIEGETSHKVQIKAGDEVAIIPPISGG